MLRLAGVKSYFSAGMASAASTTFFSYWLTWRSTSAAKLFMGCCEACVCGAGAGNATAGAPPLACPNALTATLRTIKRHNVLAYFILLNLLLCWLNRRRKRYHREGYRVIGSSGDRRSQTHSIAR